MKSILKKLSLQNSLFVISSILSLIISLKIITVKNTLAVNYYNICYIWLKYIIPSISISIIISHLLYNFNFISQLIFKLLSIFKINIFNNSKSLSLFLINIIVGNPTTSILINDAIINKEIDYREANALMACTSFVSIIFLYFTLDKLTIILYFIINFISSIFIFIIKKRIINKKDHLQNNKKNLNLSFYFKLIEQIQNKLPQVLLNIFSSLIIITTFKEILATITYFNFIIPYLELTTGILFLSNNFSLFRLIILLSLNGICINIQVIISMKNILLSKKNYLIYRIIQTLINLTILLAYFIIKRIIVFL